MLDKLKKFIDLPVKSLNAEDERLTSVLVDEKTNEEVGSYKVNSGGELVHFYFHRHRKGDKNPLTMDRCVEKAKTFIKAFYPHQNLAAPTSVQEIEGHFLLQFQDKDEQYGLSLPESGFSISVNQYGCIPYFYKAEEEYEVNYVNIITSPQEALGQFIDELDFELRYEKFSRALFKNGDNRYHLAYCVTGHVMEIPVDGTDPGKSFSDLSLEKDVQWEATTNQSIYELVGINEQYECLDRFVNNGKRLEIWSKNRHKVEAFTTTMDDAEPHIVKLCFEQSSNRLIQVLRYEHDEKRKENMSQEQAKELAIQALLTFDPSAPNYLKMARVEEEYEDENPFDEMYDKVEEPIEVDIEPTWEEYELIEEEAAYMFIFYFYHQDVRVEGHQASISIGKETGRVMYAVIDIPHEKNLKNISQVPNISLSEAKDIFKEQLEMLLSFSYQYDLEGQKNYQLCYVPTFKHISGHIRAIDAKTGQYFYVEEESSLFF
ncbi:YcdB/YcdC domain-containing protein [Alkalihalobacillus pseudalcaliphilus]|uniref:YcdB/YcdC domain-containing protein n=1 Tax=Alkalihalobacillus pseudalcaliphilus TaxID=79884 RepID=UPI00064DCFA2|nr:YcdB/YcdC domain-containing protein [Alkalihalobacillus pseudalcaliphilus]KMK76118.1 hypothetical protein AB990_12895 [Alkalihalobacillus pseudalcaliphilus]